MLAAGLGFNLHSSMKVFIGNDFFLAQGVGYKTSGALIGKPLAEGWYGYWGLGLRNRVSK